jgi:gamma-glutamyl-gamma-aminobutyrate hydrolase PuuD
MGPKARICISLERSWIYTLGAARITYQRLIWRAGGVPYRVHCPTSAAGPDIEDLAELAMRSADGLLLGGGSDVRLPQGRKDPEAICEESIRDRFELKLIEAADCRRLPILGICRGCQILNIARGGTLRVLDRSLVKRRHRSLCRHPVVLRGGSRIAEAIGRRRLPGVRSLHRRVVDRPGTGLRVSGRAPDGVTEAIESVSTRGDTAWCVGVQWHPELVAWISTEQTLIEQFVQQANHD